MCNDYAIRKITGFEVIMAPYLYDKTTVLLVWASEDLLSIQKEVLFKLIHPVQISNFVNTLNKFCHAGT